MYFSTTYLSSTPPRWKLITWILLFVSPGSYLSRSPRIFQGTPLKVNGAPGNIQGNFTPLFLLLGFAQNSNWRKPHLSWCDRQLLVSGSNLNNCNWRVTTNNTSTDHNIKLLLLHRTEILLLLISGDFGGTMGLYVGASFLTLYQLLDTIVFHFITRRKKQWLILTTKL